MQNTHNIFHYPTLQVKLFLNGISDKETETWVSYGLLIAAFILK